MEQIHSYSERTNVSLLHYWLAASIQAKIELHDEIIIIFVILGRQLVVIYKSYNILTVIFLITAVAKIGNCGRKKFRQKSTFMVFLGVGGGKNRVKSRFSPL